MKEYSATGGDALLDTPASSLTTAELAPHDDTLVRISTRLLVPSLTNRSGFNQADLIAMADTIKARGVRHPLIVRPLPGARVPDTRMLTPPGQPLPTHEIVCGERRWLASGIAGADTVPVIIRNLTDAEALEEQVVENVVRESYSAMEEGEAYHRLMTNNGLSAEEVMKKVGMSRRHVFNRLKLLDARSETREALLKGEIDATRALLLARIPDHQQQIAALARIAEKDFDGDYKLSTRAAEAMVQRDFMLNLSSAKFKMTDPLLLPEAGSCRECSKRTGHNPDLFADVKSADICTDAPCYRRKEDAAVAQVMRIAAENGQDVITGREAKALMPTSVSNIEGFLRLDDVKDSPTDKPLRKLIGNQLDAAGVKPTLIENPHKAGEMIAVLPTDKVAELLKARGHKAAASTVADDSKEATAARVEQEKKALAQQFEQAWRDQLVVATWKAMENQTNPGDQRLTDGVVRYLAGHLAEGASAARALALCQLLDLGQIATKSALVDHAKTCGAPAQFLQLLVMHQDAEHKPYIEDPNVANAGLMLIASDHGVDIEEVKAEAKAAMGDKRPKTVRSPKPLLPELHPQGGTGGVEKTSRANAAPRKKKLSSDEAQQGIAVAMQSMQNEQSDASGVILQDDRATPTLKPQASEAAVAAFVVGDRVVVRDAPHVEAGLQEFCGHVGTVKEVVAGANDSVFQYMVALDIEWHRDGVRGFGPDEIEAN